MCQFHLKHLTSLWIMNGWMDTVNVERKPWGNHKNKMLLITSTISHQDYNRTICRRQNFHHLPVNRDMNCPFLPDLQMLWWFILTEQSQRYIFTHSSCSYSGLLSQVRLWSERPRVTGLQPRWGRAGLGMSVCVAEPAAEAEPAQHRSALWAKKEAAGDRTRSPLSEVPEAGRNTWINRTTGTRTGRRR